MTPNMTSNMTAEEMASLKAQLCHERDELIAFSTRTKDDRAPVTLDQQSVGRLSRMDALQQQSMDLAREEMRLRRREMIAAALKRIEADDYGYCLVCGEDIPYKRLKADATATRCITCMS